VPRSRGGSDSGGEKKRKEGKGRVRLADLIITIVSSASLCCSAAAKEKKEGRKKGKKKKDTAAIAVGTSLASRTI